MSSVMGSLLFVSFLLFHGDLSQRILEKTAEIALHPSDYELYLERGELFLLHEEYPLAKLDFAYCIDHQMINTRVLLGISKSLLFLNNPDSALIFIDLANPDGEEKLFVLETKSTILSRLERYCEAAACMEQLLRITNNPSPVLFLNASSCFESCSETGSKEKAIQLLNDGISRLGSVGVLQKKLVSLYKQFGRYDEAIMVASAIIESSEFKIRPYFERAQLYNEMNLPSKSKDDLIAALSLMDMLPAYKQNIPSMNKLRIELNAFLNELKN